MSEGSSSRSTVNFICIPFVCLLFEINVQSGGRITRQLLKTKSGEFDIESIHSLVIRNLDISDLGCIGEAIGIERLDLSRNDITKLYSLAGLTNLTSLNISANRISSLEGLQSLDNLISLNLAGNLIGSTDTLRCLTTLEKLTELRLQDKLKGLSNPVCMNNSYKKDVISVLPNLITLDGERITGKGSELYKVCEELDELFKVTEACTADIKTPDTGPWLPPDYWEPSCKFETTSSLVDAQDQLKDLLEECKRVQLSADEKLQQALKDCVSSSAADNS